MDRAIRPRPLTVRPELSIEFLKHFDPGRQLLVLGAHRPAPSGEEWVCSTFSGPKMLSDAECWLRERFAEGAEPHMLLPDVAAPIEGRNAKLDDLVSYRFIANEGNGEDGFRGDKPAWAHAIYYGYNGKVTVVWKLDKPLSPKDAETASRKAAYHLCCGKFEAMPQLYYIPLPPNMFPVGLSGVSGCIVVRPHLGQTLIPATAKQLAVVAPAASSAPQPVAQSVRAEQRQNVSRQVPPGEDQSLMLVETLKGFGINGQIVSKRLTPATIVYAFRPPAGVTIGRVAGLAQDIANTLGKVSAQVIPAPEHKAIGIKIPRAQRELVQFDKLLAQVDPSPSTPQALLGLSETGEPELIDVTKGPHWLISGTSGSGKSVGLNVMLLSLLKRLSPEQCRFIMIDPKFTELTPYDGVPHLLSPVIVDPGEAIRVLSWLTREMKTRLKRNASVGARDITGHNRKIAEFLRSGAQPEGVRLSTMPYIVVVIDEFAQVILSKKYGAAFQELVQELAQMARAAGIHLILATQTARATVVTGVIKANLGARICFQVASQIDADVAGIRGAETLLSMGDALVDANDGRIRRVQFAFVSDEEVEAYVAELRAMGEPDYVDFEEAVDCGLYAPEVKNADGESWEGEQTVFDAGEREEQEEEPGVSGQEKGTEIAKACRFLTKALAGGPRLGNELKAEAQKIGISGTTLDRAADDFLGIKKTSTGFAKPKMWSLP
jgi:hypothetical protein